MPLQKSDVEFILKHFRPVDSFHIRPVEEVHGFQGTYYNLRVSSMGRPSTYFVKTVPEGSETVRNFYRRSGTFVKEVAVYTKLLPLLEERKVSKIWPECHVGVEGRFVVLEDLEDSGWQMTKIMDLGHILVVVDGLAKFHASSLIAAEDCRFQQLSQSVLKETMFSENADHPGRQMWDSFCRIADQILPENGVHHLFQRVVDVINSSTKFRKCLTHGDPWMNNMFFKYHQGAPIDVTFVDFQSARFAPPALDLSIFFHIFIPENADELASIYFNKLEQCLRISQRSQLITKSEFLESFEYYRESGMCIAALYIFLTRLPAKYRSEILVSQETFIKFALGRDYTPALRAMKEDQSYRDDFVQALKRVVDHHHLLHAT